MTDKEIFEYARLFRKAVEEARDSGAFALDFSFNQFPLGCCGDSSYLLAEYLRSKSVETIWYSSNRDDWSHAWLIVKDYRVQAPTPKFFSWPEDIREIVKNYGVENPDEVIDITQYEADDLNKGLIIDITGDQFADYDVPVFVGYADLFHKSFRFSQAHDYEKLGTERLITLYRIIFSFL